MTEKEYRSHPAISRSELWKLSESPEKFRWAMDNPPEPTPALLFGQVVHKLILQPDTFDDEFAILPTVDRRTAAGKEVYNHFLVASEGKSVVTQYEYERAVEMANKVRSVPLAQVLLDGKREEPYFWTDEDTGEDCKCRVDCLTEVGSYLFVVDYKTTGDASTDSFMRSAYKYGYHFQAAMYSAGVEKNLGRTPLFVFIAQEKQPPYAVNILQADDAFVRKGYDVFRELIGTYHWCKENNNWYGFLGRDEIINSLTLPSWMSKGEEE